MTSSSTSSHVVIVVAVGPADIEVDRLRDLADSVAHYDSGPATIVLVDDAPQPRHLDAILQLRPPISAISLHHPRHGAKVTFTKGKGICSAILLALQWTARNLDPALVLKLDTDSLVIGPFRERLVHLFAQHPALGMAGAYTRTPNGTERDWSHHAKTVRSLRSTFQWRRPLRSLLSLRNPTKRHVASLIKTARRSGYQYGEHCMGGGYALGGELVKRLNAAGYLNDPSLWMNVDLPEDVMIGLHTRAVGMDLANCVREGEVFGVRYMGLPDSPQELLNKGYAVIHAVKNDPAHDETNIRAFFKAVRDRREIER